MNGLELLRWLARVPLEDRDAAVEERLRIRDTSSRPPPGKHMVEYQPSGVAAIVRMLIEVPVSVDDVVVDLGSGMGKVAILASLLTGAAARGVEVQPELVAKARAAAERAGAARVTFEHGDAREAYIDDGTVFFLYAPFRGPVMAEVLGRLHALAQRKPIVVAALGVDIERTAPWLVRRPLDAFWLAIYDGAGPEARSTGLGRGRCRSALLGPDADTVAFDRDGA
jgi:SAM-dependent methyltransferase